jgi:hypothetical protein
MADEVDVMGDCSEWASSQIMGEWGYEMIFRCPQCGAMVINNFQHKVWHLQFDIKDGDNGR